MSWTPWNEITDHARIGCYLVSAVLLVLIVILFGEFFRKWSEYQPWRRTVSFLALFMGLSMAAWVGAIASLADTKVIPETVVAQGSLLMAYGDEGQIDWARPFPSAIVEHSPLRDLDGDGRREVVVVTKAENGKASRVMLLDEDGREVVNAEATLHGLLSDITQVYSPYSSGDFAIVDLIVEDLDGVDGDEILFLANDSAERPAPSLVVGMMPNGAVCTWYWHFGRLWKAEPFGGPQEWGEPSIIVLGENPLLGDEGYATVVFALSGSKFFSEGPHCWNLVSAMISTKQMDTEAAMSEYKDDDLAWSLKCVATHPGPLAWYRWIEPSSTTVSQMYIRPVREVIARGAVWLELKEERLISLDLGNGWIFRIAQNGRGFGPIRMVGGEAECEATLAP